MTTLKVPPPSLKVDAPPAPGAATLEKPVTLTSGPVLLPDGTPLTMQTLGATAGFFVYRHISGNAGSQIWDTAAKAWRVAGEPAALVLTPIPLVQRGETWEGLFVSSAEKGAIEAGPATYSFRTFFRAPFAGSTAYGFSAATAHLRFIAAADAVQAGLKIEKPESATEVTLFLRNAAKEPIGSLHMVNDGGVARIELSSSSGALIRLTASGDVELRPAPGRHVFVHDLVSL